MLPVLKVRLRVRSRPQVYKVFVVLLFPLNERERGGGVLQSCSEVGLTAGEGKLSYRAGTLNPT